MYQVTVICEKGGFASPCATLGGTLCGWTTDDPSVPMPAEVAASLERSGWVMVDGKYYCPRHDPAKQGELVRIGPDYVELAPGVRVRWRDAQEGATFPIEVQRDEPSEAG